MPLLLLAALSAQAGMKKGADSRLMCGASPLELRCQTADGKFKVVTQVNRDHHSDDFDGFMTRHDCDQNELVVEGRALGPAALIGSFYLQNEKGFNVILPGGKVAELSTYWVIPLDAKAQAATGVAKIKLAGERKARGMSAWLFAPDGTSRKDAVSCDPR